MLEREIATYLSGDKGYLAIQAIAGVGPVLAAVFCAEVGDVTRFSRPEQLAPGPGSPLATASPTPRSTVARSPSRAAASCAGRRSRPHSATTATSPTSSPPSPSARGSTKIARVAMARKIRHPRLLRPARRGDPLPGRDAGEHARSQPARVVASGHGSRKAGRRS